MVSRARLSFRRRYPDDGRLRSRYAKTWWEWCHELESAVRGCSAPAAGPRRAGERAAQAVLGGQHLNPTPWPTERHGYDPTSTRVTLR